jgi:hypothetical protein
LVFFPSHGPWCEIHGQQLTLCIQSARRDEAPPELAIEPPAWASTSHLLSANIPWFLISLLTKDRGIEVRKNPCLSSRYDRTAGTPWRFNVALRGMLRHFARQKLLQETHFFVLYQAHALI